MSTTKITIQADCSANLIKVWEAYTSPKHIVNWNFASDDWQCPKAENDLRVGGKYSARMEAKDGSWGFDFEAVYDKIIDQKHFTYSMTDGRQVAVDFEPNGHETKVTVAFDVESEHPVDMQRDGWQAILNNFKKYVEAS